MRCSRRRPAVSVRVRNGEMSATDGPFAETKEQLGGFILIEARDLNEAMRLAGDDSHRPVSAPSRCARSGARARGPSAI